MDKSKQEAIRVAHAYVYVSAAFAFLAVIAVCITVGLFFGAAWGMATFTLLCIAAAIGAFVLAREKVHGAQQATQDEG